MNINQPRPPGARGKEVSQYDGTNGNGYQPLPDSAGGTALPPGSRETNATLTDALVKAEAERDELRDEIEGLKHWRTLAMQFDRHRMTALAHLKAVVANPNATSVQAAQAFLEAAPAPGQVVELLIAADAIERIVHYVVSKGDQDVLRRIVVEKRREAGLEVAMAAKEGV